MSKENLVEQIINLHNSMYDFFKKHGVSKEHLAFKSRMLLDATDEQLIYVLSWLTSIEKNEHCELKRIRGLITEEAWTFYEQIGMEGTQEQILYQGAVDKAKRAWETRPLLLSKKFKLLGNESKPEKAKKVKK